jgi:hypothetical protein
VSSPFEDAYTYVLKDNSFTISWNSLEIGNLDPAPGCGVPVIQILTGRGSANLPSLFTVDYEAETITVGPSSNTDLSGDIYLRFKYYNSVDPMAFVTSDPPFKVTVVDGCNPPAAYATQLSLIPPTYETIHYTITDAPYAYRVPKFGASPDYCAEIIPYQEQVIIVGQAG